MVALRVVRNALAVAAVAAVAPMTFGVTAAFTPISLSTADAGSYSQNFDGWLATGQVGNNNVSVSSVTYSLPTGWAFTETGSSANVYYRVDNGGSTTGDTFAYGTQGSTERAFGTLLSGSVVPTIGAVFTNNTGQIIDSLTISYKGEQWRYGNASRTTPDTLAFGLCTNFGANTDLTAGAWTLNSNLDFASVVTSGTARALDGNANSASRSATLSSLAIGAGQTFAIRWSDVDVTGADDGLAIDDFSVSYTAHTPPANASVLTIGGGKAATIHLGRVVDNGTIATTVTLANGATDQADFSASGANAAAANPGSGSVPANASTSLTLSLAGSSTVGVGTNIASGSGPTTVSGTVTISNSANLDDAAVVVTLDANVVENRYVNANNAQATALGKAIKGARLSLDATFSTTNANADKSSDALTTITMPAGPAVQSRGTFNGKVAATASELDSPVVFDDGADAVTRTITLDILAAGNLNTNTSSNYLAISCTSDGTPGETSDPTARIYFNLTGLDHANPSLVAGSDVKTGTVDLGSFDANTGLHDVDLLQIVRNLTATTNFTAALDLDAIAGESGDLGAFDLSGAFTNLAAGSAADLHASVVAGEKGHYEATFKLSFSDEDLPGATATDPIYLTLTADVVPEPASLAMLGLGLLAVSWRRR